MSCSTPSMSPRRLTSTAIVPPGGIAQQQVDRADRGRELPAHEGQPVADDVDLLGEQPLQVGLDAVLHQPGIDAEFVGRVVQDLVDAHQERVAGLGVRHPPQLDDAVVRHPRHPAPRTIEACRAGSSS